MARATNGVGWVVQQYIHEYGWGAVTRPMSQEEAQAELPNWQSQDAPARVYEALNHPSERTHEHLIPA